MSPSRQTPRVDVIEIKAQLLDKIGRKRSDRYFHHLTGLLSSRLSKKEFDKLCIAAIGRENIALHNKLISSIFKNASLADLPPPLSKEATSEGSQSVGVGGPCQRNHLFHDPGRPWCSRKVRTKSLRDCKVRDRPSPLGPNGKTNNSAQHNSNSYDEPTVRAPDNGGMNSCDLHRPVEQNMAEMVSIDSRTFVEVVTVEEGEEVEQEETVSSRSPLRAPLGVPFCPMSIGSARSDLTGDVSGSFRENTELPDAESLRKRMELMANSRGLHGVTMDAANLLNNGLDVFMKRMIEACLVIPRARTRHYQQAMPHDEKQFQQVPSVNHFAGMNGFYESDLRLLRGRSPAVYRETTQQSFMASMLDFRVAMEMKPHLLGEDWPIQLEKILLHSLSE
ncbi:uncharacterized protein LOC116260525 [Nymphaea colorata]|nr:uncharacterized protein LOC116260525 [Nymphaea colorata]